MLIREAAVLDRKPGIIEGSPSFWPEFPTSGDAFFGDITRNPTSEL